MKKKIIIACVTIGLVGLGMYFAMGKKDFSVNKEFELGDSISIEKIAKADFDGEFTIVEKDSVFDSKKMIPVGVYEFVAEDAHSRGVYQIEIKDTTKPTFKKFTKEIRITEKEDSIDWSKYFEGKDLASFKMSVDGKVEFGKAGEYPIEVTLKDESKNKLKKSSVVVIEEEKKVVENTSANANTNTNTNANENNNAPAPSTPSVVTPTYVQGILIVNKVHPIPANFAYGENPTAGAQVRKLIADMQSQGYNISSSYSGYRSNAYQASLYNGYVAASGQAAADTYSARPGYSEHETGLAFDLIDGNGQLVESQPEAEWIRTHAHEYGFIVRYPFGKEYITGFMPEPWHLRYIGSRAGEIYASGLCLEEFLGVEGGTQYR